MESKAKLLGHPIHPILILFPLALLPVDVSWSVRLGNVEYAPSILPFVLALVGMVLALVTAWLRGELVYRLRIGVDDVAGVDAPSSLGASAADGRESEGDTTLRRA